MICICGEELFTGHMCRWAQNSEYVGTIQVRNNIEDQLQAIINLLNKIAADLETIRMRG